MLYDKRWELETPPFALLEPWQQVLLQAADVLERQGWCQGHYHRNGKHCAIGAIAYAARNSPGPLAPKTVSWRATRNLKAALGGLGIGQWNDHPDRTMTEVVAKMREVARS